jgi:hypothetical protein
MHKARCIFVVLCLLLSPYISLAAAPPTGRVIHFSGNNWYEYRNERESYVLKLPPEIKTNFTRHRDPEQAAQELLPFDYVNFTPKQAAPDSQPFELGLGVHWNKYNMTARVFADSKDEGVKRGVRQYVTLRSASITVAGIEGVRDDFALEKEYGWTTYTRVIIPYQNNFYCFLCTLGKDKAVPQYEQLFEKIIASFKLQTG